MLHRSGDTQEINVIVAKLEESIIKFGAYGCCEFGGEDEFIVPVLPLPLEPLELRRTIPDVGNIYTSIIAAEL